MKILSFIFYFYIFIETYFYLIVHHLSLFPNFIFIIIICIFEVLKVTIIILIFI